MNSVLIIDDDKELCVLMKKCVEQENLFAVVAHGGLEGLAAAGRKQRYLFPDYFGCDDARYKRLSGVAENPREK